MRFPKQKVQTSNFKLQRSIKPQTSKGKWSAWFETGAWNLKVLWSLMIGVWSFQAMSAVVPGDEAIVVYNSRLPASKALADYYAQRRQVPTNQIFGFSLETGEDISRAEFRDSLQKPLAEELEKRKLWHIASEIVPATTNRPARVDWRVVESKIRYLVLCYGVPLRISHDPNLEEEGTENLRPEMKRNGA